jgi:hypothetical protein
MRALIVVFSWTQAAQTSGASDSALVRLRTSP